MANGGHHPKPQPKPKGPKPAQGTKAQTKDTRKR